MILEKWKIINIVDNKQTFVKILQLSSVNKNDIQKCQLKSMWYTTPVAPGQYVYIKAKLEEDCYCVDNSFGFIVLFPDTLISGTTVVGSLFCRRKGVLQQKFGQLEGSNKSVSFIHKNNYF